MAIEARIEGKKLIITCDFEDKPAPSSSGKSLNVVNSQGIYAGEYSGKPLSINVTAYIPNDRSQVIPSDHDITQSPLEPPISVVSVPDPINATVSVHNVQDINVGNLGDILKHAALMNISELILGKCGCDTAYIDTHTYKLYARFPYPRKWREDTDNLNRYTQYNQYIEAQNKALEDDLYRCSSGLIIDRFKQFGCEKTISGILRR